MAKIRATRTRIALAGAMALLPLLAACSPDHLYSNRGNAL